LRVLKLLNLDGVCLRALSLIPAHVGLGSTTQLLLASAMAALAVKGLELDPLDVATRVGRGRVSWVGSLLFKLGGFVIDSGTPSLSRPRPLARLEVPEVWEFVMVTPSVERGFREDEEQVLLDKPWNPSLEASYHMSRGALRLASAIARGDLGDALEGLREVQLGTGLYFSRVQGGVYRGVLEAVVERAASRGVILAQSSWGPTLYTITGEGESTRIAEILRGLLKELGLGGSVRVSKPRNRGATILKL